MTEPVRRGSSGGPKARSVLSKRWLLTIVAACSSGDAPAPVTTDVPASAITKHTENGPVKVTLAVWPAEPSLGDPIHLRLTVEAEPGVSVDLPFQEDALGRFDVAGYQRSERRGDGGKRIQIQDYELQAPSSGRHRIPPLRLEMLDARTGSGAAPVELLTDEVPLAIAAVDAGRTDGPLPAARVRLDPDVGGTPWMPWLLAGLISIWIVLGVVIWRRVRTRQSLRAKQSAYDTAVERLRVLEQRGAPAAEDADGWFVELSSIVRRYIERRYDIRAPELTTEEFLQVASRSAELTDAHRDLLSSFMARCDRVKFAAWRPNTDESLDTLRAARGFVEDTRFRTTEAVA
jgi:hypothetical protein